MNAITPPSAKITHKFAFKIMASAFCGIHVPLVGMMIYLFSISGTPSALRIIFAVLVFTLMGASVTLLVLSRMMRPIQTGSQVLQRFISSREIQSMPDHAGDELGILFQQIEYLMFVLQKTVSERDRILGVAITTNEDFQQSLKQFINAREDAFLQRDDNKMKAALEDVLSSVRLKLESAGQILHTFTI
jgi:hypothetical protein